MNPEKKLALNNNQRIRKIIIRERIRISAINIFIIIGKNAFINEAFKRHF